MNEFEKKIRNKLLMRGFPNEKLINNRGLIGATIDEVILEVVKNIGVTRCCTAESEQLKYGHKNSFKYWLEENNYKKVYDKYVKCGFEYSESDLIYKYNEEVMNL